MDKQIKTIVVNIKEYHFTNNLKITCELYRLFDELSIECFNENLDKKTIML